MDQLWLSPRRLETALNGGIFKLGMLISDIRSLSQDSDQYVINAMLLRHGRRTRVFRNHSSTSKDKSNHTLTAVLPKTSANKKPQEVAPTVGIPTQIITHDIGTLQKEKIAYIFNIATRYPEVMLKHMWIEVKDLNQADLQSNTAQGMSYLVKVTGGDKVFCRAQVSQSSICIMQGKVTSHYYIQLEAAKENE